MLKVDSLEHLFALAGAGELLGPTMIPADWYHAGPGLSSTDLKAINRSPAHWNAMETEPRDTPAMRLGRMIHTRVLEPEVFVKDYARSPSFDRRTKVGKEEAAIWEAMGKIAYTDDEAEILAGVEIALAENGVSKSLLSAENGIPEMSVYWMRGDILCKARADLVVGNTLVDLKTTQDARPKAFQRSIADYGYHLSAAHYCDGFKEVFGHWFEFMWVAVETKKPHGVMTYLAEAPLLGVGLDERNAALETFKRMQEWDSGKMYPGYPEITQTIGLPAWYGKGEV